ncbi:hypothetical protein EVA_18879 [gut metagenome]|uniref:Uncharacterized protein n=1 Tax=gut metagenome TaxID=749906 RepID=J9BZL8_9ZZZZ
MHDEVYIFHSFNRIKIFGQLWIFLSCFRQNSFCYFIDKFNCSWGCIFRS